MCAPASLSSSATQVCSGCTLMWLLHLSSCYLPQANPLLPPAQTCPPATTALPTESASDMPRACTGEASSTDSPRVWWVGVPGRPEPKPPPPPAQAAGLPTTLTL